MLKFSRISFVQQSLVVLTRCAGDVHLLEAPALEDADGELSGGGDVSVNEVIR